MKMTWLTRIWRCRRGPAMPAVVDDVQEAVAARRREERALQRAVEERPQVESLAEQLRHHREVNHFAELFGDSFGRNHP